jgi:hypothetical protein
VRKNNNDYLNPTIASFSCDKLQIDVLKLEKGWGGNGGGNGGGGVLAKGKCIEFESLTLDINYHRSRLIVVIKTNIV